MIINTSLLASNTQPKVVVVGGGLSGLMAAYRLVQSGVDVSLYEARDRVGGRVFSVEFEDEVVELGGQSISDGGEAPTMFKAMEEFNLKCTTRIVSTDHLFYNGTSCVDVREALLEKFDSFDAVKLRLDKLAFSCANMKEVLDALELDQHIYSDLRTRLCGYEGGELEELSTSYTETLYYLIVGGLSSQHKSESVSVLTIEGGNSALPECLSRELGDRLHLEKLLVEVGLNKEKYQLRFQSGEIIEADVLVITIPVSTMQDVIFAKDVIDQDKLENIKKLKCGKNAKIIVPFSGVKLSSHLVDDRAVSFFSSDQKMTIFLAGQAGNFSQGGIEELYQSFLPGMQNAYPNIQFSNQVLGHSWASDPFSKGSYSFVSAGQEKLLSEIDCHFGQKFLSLFSPIQKSLFFAGEHTAIDKEIRGTMEAACESGERVANAIKKAYQFPN